MIYDQDEAEFNVSVYAVPVVPGPLLTGEHDDAPAAVIIDVDATQILPQPRTYPDPPPPWAVFSIACGMLLVGLSAYALMLS